MLCTTRTNTIWTAPDLRTKCNIVVVCIRMNQLTIFFSKHLWQNMSTFHYSIQCLSITPKISWENVPDVYINTYNCMCMCVMVVNVFYLLVNVDGNRNQQQPNTHQPYRFFPLISRYIKGQRSSIIPFYLFCILCSGSVWWNTCHFTYNFVPDYLHMEKYSPK